jgi:hypothetical protein
VLFRVPLAIARISRKPSRDYKSSFLTKRGIPEKSGRYAMPAKVRSLLCAAIIPCGERNSNVSDPSETCICRPPFAALTPSVFVLC